MTVISEKVGFVGINYTKVNDHPNVIVESNENNRIR